MHELDGAPWLRKLKQEGIPPPEVPEAYFETMAQKWEDQLVDEEVMAQAPTLQRAGKRLPFEVPSGYFEALPKRIMRRIADTSSTKVRPIWVRMTYRAVAVAAVLSLMALIWLPDVSDTTPAYQAWEDIPTEALLVMVEEEVNDPEMILDVIGPPERMPFLDMEPDIEEDLLEEWLEEAEVSDLEEVLLEEE